MSQLDEIHSELKTVHGTVDILNNKMELLIKWQGAVDERCKIKRESISNIKTTLFGNPAKQNGLVSKVQCLMDNKKRQLTSREFWQGVLQKVITWAIIAVIVWALWTYKMSGG